MPLKNSIPAQVLPIGKPVAVSQDNDPILIRNSSAPQSQPAVRSPLKIPQTGGGRSGVGRLQKMGGMSSPNTAGGYDSSGINPSAGRPNAPIRGGAFNQILSRLGRARR